VGWKYRSGWVEWEFDWNAFAAWYEAENYKDSPQRIYNGSGQLIYRGAVMGYRQPIPSMGFLPGHMEAIIDLRNLLAQGYVPVLGQDGQTVYLVQSARSVRGGVSFTF